MNIKQLIGTRIRELRQKRRMTQAELAEEVGIATKHQSCIETGRNFPSAELFERYAIAFRINPEELFALKSFNPEKSRKDIIDEIIKNINISSDYELNIIEKFVAALHKK